MTETDSRSGFALAAAVFALVVLGVFVTGGFYIARQELRIGVATERAGAAFYLAERGAMEALSQWEAGRFASLAQWSSTTVADTVNEGIWSVEVTRMSNYLYFLQANGAVTAGQAVYGGATRTLGIVARLNKAPIDPPAALATVGELTIGGHSSIVGADSTPAGWSGLCDPTVRDKPGILIDSLSNVNLQGNAHDVVGDPPILEDNTLTTGSLMGFGEDEWADLVALADLVFPDPSFLTQLYPDSALVGGSYVCQTASELNWGDPHHPSGACGAHFPVVNAAGDMRISAHGYGQGILLVEGDLTVTGGFEFYGPVLVRGTVATGGTGGHFNGGLIAANISLNTTTVLGDAMVQYSSCAVERAVLNSSLTQILPLDRRSWVDLSSLVNDSAFVGGGSLSP